MNKVLLFGLCIVSLLVVSCGMTKDEFGDEYAKASCKKDVSCGAEYTEAECREQIKPWIDLAMASCSGFDSEYAEKCVDCVKGLTCDQWAEFNDDESEGEYCTSCEKTCD